MRMGKIICKVVFIALALFLGILEKPVFSRDIWKDPVLGIEFIKIKGGCYKMGCSPADSNSKESCYFDEKPLHEVCVKDFWISTTEITVSQWNRFVKETGYKPKKEELFGACISTGLASFSQQKNDPVVCVSWHDAKAFANWLSKKTGFRIRLPYEAEWEYVCKSGKNKPYPWGDTISGNNANYWSGPGGIQGKDIWKFTSPVKSFPSTGHGVYDIIGNAAEWCEDWYDPFYYQKSPKNNPKGASSSPRNEKVARGGAWNERKIKKLRCSERIPLDADSAYSSVGFRLVRE